MDKIKKRWLGFLAMGLGFAAVYLDQTALNVALPTIQEQFEANETQLFWILNAYLLPLAIFGLSSGRLGDMLGLRTIFLWGLSIFVVASIGCALAFSPWFLIMFRAFQGLGGAAIPVVIAASVFHLFPEGKRGKPMGCVGFMAAVSILVGPIIGGLFTTYGTWRWIFWINPIIGVCCFALVYFLTKELDSEREKNTTFDFKGQILFFAFLVPLITALMQGENWGWGSATIIILLSVGALFLPIFVWYERRAKHPLFDFKLMKNFNFSIACIVFFCGQFAFVASVFIALYLIKSLGKSAFEAGLCLMPVAILAGIMNPVAGHLTEKIGYRKQIQLGLLGCTIGYLFISITAHTLTYFWLLIGLVINGLSVSTFFMATYALIIHSTPKHQQGMASGMAATFRQMGASFAMSIVGIIIIVFQRKGMASSSLEEKFARGFSVGMAFVSFIMCIALVASIWIDRKKTLNKDSKEDEIPTRP
ncbi:MAG: Multidrug resistance protein Stp [Chlamydiae bacterium]|nr:Multidrug resistance protein Stp [Chlamydiota bacterium]